MTSFILLPLMFGCADFLEEQSQSEVRPSTVEDMEKIMEGQAYFTSDEGVLFNTLTEIFTDDLECVVKEDEDDSSKKKKENKRYLFSWDRKMFDEQGGGEDISWWTIPYERIMGCNVVLDYIDNMKGNEHRKQYVKGEAYALRAFYYLTLVNFFGWPYNEGDPSVNRGVPLKLKSTVTEEFFTRNSVAEVYAQIVKDFLMGAKLMEENPERFDITRLNHWAAYALLSRVYLYMEDWDNVIKYCDLVLEKNSSLVRLCDIVDGNVYDREFADEILWAGYLSNNSDYIETMTKVGYIPSTGLLNLYGEDVDNGILDVRVNVDTTNGYFIQGKNREGTWFAGVRKSLNSELSGGIRVAEVYLNRAEAYIRKYMATGETDFGIAALKDLNKLREYRFAAGYEDKDMADFANAEELLAFCLRERRRELVHEANSRWFDLRRLGMPKIEHVYWLGNESQVFVLEQKDPRYVLPIPERVLEQNPNLSQN